MKKKNKRLIRQLQRDIADRDLTIADKDDQLDDFRKEAAGADARVKEAEERALIIGRELQSQKEKIEKEREALPEMGVKLGAAFTKICRALSIEPGHVPLNVFWSIVDSHIVPAIEKLKADLEDKDRAADDEMAEAIARLRAALHQKRRDVERLRVDLAQLNGTELMACAYCGTCQPVRKDQRLPCPRGCVDPTPEKAVAALQPVDAVIRNRVALIDAYHAAACRLGRLEGGDLDPDHVRIHMRKTRAELWNRFFDAMETPSSSPDLGRQDPESESPAVGTENSVSHKTQERNK